VFAVAGGTGLKHSGGRIDEEYARGLKGRKAIEQYQEMLDSPLPGAVMLMIDLMTRSVDWPAKAADESDAASVRAAELWDEIRGDMRTDWRTVVAEHMTAVPFGWHVSEALIKLRRGPDAPVPELRSDYSDGLFGLLDLSPRSQDSLDRWTFDSESGEAIEMVQNISGADGGVFYVPLSKCLHYVPRPYKRSPEGRSMFRPGHRSWFYGRKLEDTEALGFDKELTNVIVQQLPVGIMTAAPSDAGAAAVRADWAEKVKKLRMGTLAGLLVPSKTTPDGKPTGYETAPLSAGGSRMSADPAIRRHESRLLISLLANVLAMGGDASSGGASRALADPMLNLLLSSVSALLDAFADAVTQQIIPLMMRLNGVPQHAWPTQTHGPVDTPDLPELMGLLTSGVREGVILPSASLSRYALTQIPGAPVDELAEPVDETVGLEPDNVVPLAGPATAPTEAIPAAETALNGAQVTSAVEIVGEVAAGRLPRATGVAMLQEFFNLELSRAERIMGEVGRGFSPEPAEGTPPSAPTG
jgi:hypothetical protein